MAEVSIQHATDLKVALLTPRGRGAVATICFAGDCSRIDALQPPLFRAANGKPLGRQPVNHVIFGHWGCGETTEEVVLCRVDENTLEIHCHGGDVAARRILNDLESIGCRVETWQQFQTDSAGLFETECLEALTRATTQRTAAILLEQQSGILRTALELIRSELETEMEHGEWNPIHREEVLNRLNDLLKWSSFGVHLTQPFNVVLAGRPNVGKSSLINALVGYARSIVYEQPGTTRDVVTAETAFEGWPVTLADTAGIRQAGDQLESAGIERTAKMLNEADCRVLLMDTSQPPQQEDQQLLAQWPDALIVAHKSDLPNIWNASELPAEALPVSAKTGDGVEALTVEIVSRLVPEVPCPGTAIPVTQRQVDRLHEARTAAEKGSLAACLQAVWEILS